MSRVQLLCGFRISNTAVVRCSSNIQPHPDTDHLFRDVHNEIGLKEAISNSAENLGKPKIAHVRTRIDAVPSLLYFHEIIPCLQIDFAEMTYKFLYMIAYERLLFS